MKTIKKIRDSIKVEVGKRSDDIDLPNKFIDDKIKDVRVSLIRDEIRRTRKLNERFYQIINDVEVKKLERVTATTLTLTSGWYISMPGLMKSVMYPILSLTSHDFQYKYDIVPYQKWLVSMYRRHGSYMPVGTLIDDMILFHNKPYGKKLVATVLLENYDQAYGFTDETIMPVPGDLLFKLETLVIKSILEPYGIMYDPQNDNSIEAQKQNDKDTSNK